VRHFVLRHIATMANDIVQSSRDWLSSPRTSALAWWIPKAAIVVALFIPPPARTGVWIILAANTNREIGAAFATFVCEPLRVIGGSESALLENTDEHAEVAVWS